MKPLLHQLYETSTENLYRKETPVPPSGSLVSGHYKKDSDYCVYRSSGSNNSLLIYTISGKGHVRHHHQLHTCTAGDLLILMPGYPHDYFTAENSTWEFMWSHFIPRESWSAWLNINTMDGLFLLNVKDSTVQTRIENAFKRLVHDNQSSANKLQNELVMNALEEIMLLVTELQYAGKNRRNIDPRIQEVLDYLSQHLEDDLSVPELARMVSLSPSRLSHLFKQQTGDSIINALLRMRLQEGAKLLQFTPHQITEIARDVGFNSPHYFSRKFAYFYGLSPSEFRKKFQ